MKQSKVFMSHVASDSYHKHFCSNSVFESSRSGAVISNVCLEQMSSISAFEAPSSFEVLSNSSFEAPSSSEASANNAFEAPGDFKVGSNSSRGAKWLQSGLEQLL